MDQNGQQKTYGMGGQQQGATQQQYAGGQAVGGISSGGLLQQVTQATTIERGLATLRQGIADQLATNLGGALNDRPTGGGTAAKLELPQEAVTNLNQLYIGLTTDNEAWAEALIANTPMAETTDESAERTTSRAAMA